MTVFVDSVDVDAAWEVYYRLADRRHQPGLTYEELTQVIEAALKPRRSWDGIPAHHPKVGVEVEEHQ